VLTTHAGTIRYAREADTLLFSRHAKQSRTCEPNDARFPQLPSFTFFAEIKFSVGTVLRLYRFVWKRRAYRLDCGSQTQGRGVGRTGNHVLCECLAAA
jgi:hypothetical protein